jgi:hypothetical protein
MTSLDEAGHDGPARIAASPAAPESGVSDATTLAGLLPRFTLCEVLVACGMMLVVVGALLQVFVVREMQVLVGDFGWGHVPREQVPDGRVYDVVSRILNFAGYALTLSAFFTGMARVRRIAGTALGSRFEYGYGWTVGALFVPIICLFRPWVGLAEIRSSITGAGRTGRPGPVLADNPGGGPTWALAVIFFIGTTVHLGLTFAMTSKIPPGADAFAAWCVQALGLLTAGLVIQTAVYGAFLLYLITLHRPLRRVALSGPTKHPS